MFVPFLGKPFYLLPSCFGFRASAHNFIKQTLIRAPVNGCFSRNVNSHDYFPNNFRNSLLQVFFKIAVLKHLHKKTYTATDVFLEIFSNFSTQLFRRTLPGVYFSNSESLLVEWQLSISFFEHFSIFWIFSLRFRVAFKLLAINFLHGGDSRRVYFFIFTHKILLCLVGSYWWDDFRFHQSIHF